MKCTYIGNFNDTHNTSKKRRLIGPAMNKALTAITDKKLSCETYREIEANRLMKIGMVTFLRKIIKLRVNLSIVIIFYLTRGNHFNNNVS